MPSQCPSLQSSSDSHADHCNPSSPSKVVPVLAQAADKAGEKVNFLTF
jgi:hypothetical protein